MTIDLNKQYRTRDGRAVRLISDQGHPDRPIIGYIDDSTIPNTWTRDGLFVPFGHSNMADLVEEKASFHGDVWLVVMLKTSTVWSPGSIISDHKTKAEAEREAKRLTEAGRACAIQRVTLNVTEGEITE